MLKQLVLDIIRLHPDYKREAILEIVKDDGYKIVEYKQYQNDKEIVKAAVENNEWAIQYCKYDREIVELAVKQNGSVIKFCHEFKTDREIVELAVKNYKWAIRYCPQFQDDKEIVELIKDDKDALSYCSERLQKMFN